MLFRKFKLYPAGLACLLLVPAFASGEESADDEDYSYVSSDVPSSDSVSGTVLVNKGKKAAKTASSPAEEAKAGMGVTLPTSSRERTRQWLLDQKAGKTGASPSQAEPEKTNLPASKLKPSTEKSSIPHPEGNTTDAPPGFDTEFSQTKRTPGGRKVIGLDTRGDKWEKTQKKTPVKLEKRAGAKTEAQAQAEDEDAPEPLVDATDEIMQTGPSKAQIQSSGKKKAAANETAEEFQEEEMPAATANAKQARGSAAKAASKGKKGKTSGPELLPLPEDPEDTATASGRASARKRKASSVENTDNASAAKETSSSEPVSLFDQKFDGDMPLAAQRKARKSSGK